MPGIDAPYRLKPATKDDVERVATHLLKALSNEPPHDNPALVQMVCILIGELISEVANKPVDERTDADYADMWTYCGAFCLAAAEHVRRRERLAIQEGEAK